MENKPKFKDGTTVRVVKYGFMGFSKTGHKDILPGIVGKEATIICSEKRKNEWRYMVRGIPIMTGWYREEQLEEIF